MSKENLCRNKQKLECEMAEMLEIIEKAREIYANDITDHTENEYIREGLLDAGYHKQSEGEWVKVYRNKKCTVYECSNCKHLTFGTSDYCICGTKMKGGEE